MEEVKMKERIKSGICILMIMALYVAVAYIENL